MKRLKSFRKEKGLSQDKMAKELDITLSMYEKVESGRANASAAFMKRIKKRFPEANIDYIFFESNSNNFADCVNSLNSGEGAT